MKVSSGHFLKNFLYYLILIFIALISIGPFLWLVFSSMTPESYILGKSHEAVRFTLSNYRGFVDYINLPLTFRNTLIISVGSILIDIVFSSLCAYPLAFMEFPGKTLIMYMLLGTMIFPAAAGMVINYMIISRMHLMDTMLGVILPSAVHPFSILILRQSFRLVSKDGIDAARVDGASDSSILIHVLLPAIGPGIVTVALFDFISSWNSFLWPLIVLQDPDKYPLATMLRYIYGAFGEKSGYIEAGTVIAMIPVIVIVFLLQKIVLNYVEDTLI